MLSFESDYIHGACPEILNKLIETNIAIMDFQLLAENQEKGKELAKKFIKDSKKAIKIVENVKHIEILTSLFNAFVSGKQPYFIAIAKTISLPNKIRHWDTKKGFKEFIEEERLAVAKSEQELEEKRKERERIEQAKKDGKKVELMYINGKVKPVIVEEKPN